MKARQRSKATPEKNPGQARLPSASFVLTQPGRREGEGEAGDREASLSQGGRPFAYRKNVSLPPAERDERKAAHPPGTF